MSYIKAELDLMKKTNEEIEKAIIKMADSMRQYCEIGAISTSDGIRIQIKELNNILVTRRKQMIELEYKIQPSTHPYR